MSVLLDLIYLIVLVLASPWILYRLIAKRDGGNLALRFGFGLGPALSRSIWLHGSSAGEVALLKPMVRRLERDFPDTPIVISAFTSTGLSIARATFARHTVVPFPLDFWFVVKRMLNRFDPALVVVVESEFWPNFLRAANVRGVPTVLLNGKMSAKSYAMHSRTRLIRKVLSTFAVIAVQQEEHAERFRSLDVPEDRIVVTGNMKYDLTRAERDPDRRAALRARLAYRRDDIVVIGGSLHDEEDAALLDAFGRLAHNQSNVCLIVVPRYPSDAAKVAQRAASRGYRAVLMTALDRAGAEAPGRDGVLIVDTVGQLGDLYAAADVAYVGGSLFYRGANKGGHNLMEPAILGLPVLFGPYNFSFKETVTALLAADGGVLVHDVDELATALQDLCADAPRRAAMGERARGVILAGQGAAKRNYALIGGLLDSRLARLQPSSQPRTMPPASRTQVPYE
jgi:3-deoxy-D-manno-octulosonic-acid transferase